MLSRLSSHDFVQAFCMKMGPLLAQAIFIWLKYNPGMSTKVKDTGLHTYVAFIIEATSV